MMSELYLPEHASVVSLNDVANNVKSAHIESCESQPVRTFSIGRANARVIIRYESTQLSFDENVLKAVGIALIEFGMSHFYVTQLIFETEGEVFGYGVVTSPASEFDWLSRASAEIARICRCALSENVRTIVW